MADYSSLIDGFAPLTAAGIDPDVAAADKDAALARLAELQHGTAGTVSTPDSWNAATPSGAASAAPSSVSQSGNRDADVSSALGKLGDLTDRASSAVSADAQGNQQYLQQAQALQARRAQVAQPIAAYGADNKILPQYKPSWGDRFLRGAQAVARGGVLGAIDPRMEGLPGYGAPNATYQRAVGSQQAQVAAIDAQEAALDKTNKTRSDLQKGTAAEYRQLAGLSRDALTGATNQQNADTEVQNANTKAAEAHWKSPEGQAEIEKMNVVQRGTLGKQLGLKGSAQQRFALTGKMPEEFAPDHYHPGADVQELAMARQAFRAAHGGKDPQTPEEMSAMINSARGKTALGVDPVAPGSPVDPQIKAMANGDIKMPSAGNRSPQALALRKAVLDYDPTFTDSRYDAKQNFKTKGDATNVQRLGTAILHADRGLTNSDAMGVAPAFNTKLQSANDAPYKEDADFLAGEVGQFVTGGKLTVEEGHKLESNLYSIRPDTRRNAINEMLSLSGGKLKSQTEKYKAATGQDFPTDTFFNDPEIYSALQRHGIIGGNAPAASSAGDNIPPQVASQLEEGVVHTFSNGQSWTKQNGQPVRVK